MADWVTISALATAGGTAALAAATFVSVRSANRAARVAEQSLLVGLRPLLMPSRFQDPLQKIMFQEGKWLMAPGGGGVAEATDEAVYLGMALRNAGQGIAVLHGWTYFPGFLAARPDHAPLEDFIRLTRDLYLPPNDVGFWQGTFRDTSSAEYAAARAAIEARERMTIEILYGDHEGGQRVISRFAFIPREDDGWIATSARHWNIDRQDPR